VLFNLQRALYSHRNWVGVSPFAFISGVNMRCQPGKSGLTEVVVKVNRARTLFYAGYWVWAAGMASVAAPTLVDALFIFAASVPVAWIGNVIFLGGYLLNKEITNSLKT
jgi:hypothetical protein